MNAPPPKILLVEDVEDNRGIVRQLVRRLGWTLLEAEDGEQGIALARSELPDLILMDLSLPVLDGWEATRRLKTDPLTARIPVVALTAHAMAGDEQAVRALGADGYVAKPISLLPFRELLKELVGRERVTHGP